MSYAINSCYQNVSVEEIIPKINARSLGLKFSAKNWRKILKAFLLGRLHRLFCELFEVKIQSNINSSMESYTMDSKIIQLLIQGIVDTGEYTLEGIAHYTRIPFDVIYDAAYGASNQFTITPWARVVDLYIQVKPDVEQALIDKFLEIKGKNHTVVSSLLVES